MNTLDDPFLAPPGSYPPATVRWMYNSTTVPAGLAEWIVPSQPGTPLGIEIPIVWSLTQVFFRVENPGTTNSTLQFARYTGTSGFSTTNFLNDVPIIITPGAHESIGRPYTLATINNPLVNSFDKLQPVFSLGAGASIVIFVATFSQTPGV